jgi:hypothetical protein
MLKIRNWFKAKKHEEITLSSPFSLTEEEARTIFDYYSPYIVPLAFRWKDMSYRDCNLLVVPIKLFDTKLFDVVQKSLDMPFYYSDIDFEFTLPNNFWVGSDWWKDINKAWCLGHTSFLKKEVAVHDRQWTTPAYNTDLHVLLHEIAHVKVPPFGIPPHGVDWEREFRKLCNQSGFSPNKKHLTSEGLTREFF